MNILRLCLEDRRLLVILVFILIITFYLSYKLYRVLIFKINKNINWAKQSSINKNDYRLKDIKVNEQIRLMHFNIINQLKEKAIILMKRAGESRSSAYFIYLVFAYLIPFVFAFMALIIYRSLRGLVLAIFFKLLVEYLVHNQIKKEEMKFRKNAYKLYKYLNNQISSGVKHTDAIKSLYKAVNNDDVLRERLMLMSATYISTNNIDYALTFITDFYNTLEANSLAVAIKQGINTGSNQSAFEKKEKHMFNKYIHIIQKETDLLKLKHVGIAVVFAIIILVLICYPLYLDFIDAQQKLFTAS